MFSKFNFYQCFLVIYYLCHRTIKHIQYISQQLHDPCDFSNDHRNPLVFEFEAYLQPISPQPEKKNQVEKRIYVDYKFLCMNHVFKTYIVIYLYFNCSFMFYFILYSPVNRMDIANLYLHHDLRKSVQWQLYVKNICDYRCRTCKAFRKLHASCSYELPIGLLSNILSKIYHIKNYNKFK